MTKPANAMRTDWLAFAREISLAPAATIDLIRERGADVRIARATAPDGRAVVIKLWNRPGWRGLLRRLTRSNPANREWQGLNRMRQAGVEVPEPLACLPHLGAGAAHTEALITQDLGPCENGVDHLKALIAAGDMAGEQAFVESIVQATARMVEHGFLDIDHRLPNFIAAPSGHPVRLDFELIARRPLPHLWRREYGHMLGTLIGSFVFAVQPDVKRAQYFAKRLRDTLTPPAAVLALAEKRMREMLEKQYCAIGMKVDVGVLWPTRETGQAAPPNAVDRDVEDTSVGVVVIGRNEGDRLRRCLESVVGRAGAVVYVDSGSSDGSVALAESMGASVVDLDLDTPFTAARARNTGFARLCTIAPDIEFVQFVDGDCEIIDGWLGAATQTLADRPEVTVLAGRLNERFPERSIYNRLGDLEWNKAGVGEVSAVGGIFMIRRAAFERLGGFNPSVAAGEEPELCARLRAQGGRLWRLDQAMAWHDLAMTRLGQWWRRQARNGYGGLDVTRRFGMTHFRANLLRARFWSLSPLLAGLAGLAVGSVAGATTGLAATLAGLLLGPAQMLRMAVRTRRQGEPWSVALPFAFFAMLSFWPNMQGQLRYLQDHRHGRVGKRIEYKQAAG